MACAVGWMFVSPKIHITLIPNVMVFGGDWVWIRLCRWRPLDETSALTRGWRDQSSLSTVWEYSKKAAICKPGIWVLSRSVPCWHPHLRFLSSRTARKKCLLFKSQSFVFCYSSMNWLRQYVKMYSENWNLCSLESDLNGSKCGYKCTYNYWT